MYCAECRTGPHQATRHCACCEDCGRFGEACKCGCPPRGVKLTARQLNALWEDCQGRDKNSGAPFWTERVLALLDHISIQDAFIAGQAARIKSLIQPALPGV